MAVSVFDLFKIGIGPSSARTRSARCARRGCSRCACSTTASLQRTARVRRRAVRLARRHRQGARHRQGGAAGAGGRRARHVDVESDPGAAGRDPRRRAPALLGAHPMAFDERQRPGLPRAARRCRFHANGMRFIAFDAAGRELADRALLLGGRRLRRQRRSRGRRQRRSASRRTPPVLPHPFHSGDELLGSAQRDRPDDRGGDARQRARTGAADAEIDAGLLTHLARDAGLRGARLRTDGDAARRLQGQAPRAGAAPRR